MALGLKVLIRICVVLFYCIVFVGLYGALQVYLASPPSIQDSREYGPGEGPDYFPVLVVDRALEGQENLVLRSLAKADYAGMADTGQQDWSLYRIPGAGRLDHADHADRVDFRVETLSESRQQVEISIAEANGQRTSVYTYEIKEEKVSPRSYLLLASFGDNFSPLPFTVLFTVIIILLVEKFLVRRLFRPSNSPERQ